ncbi:hypothetical protein BX600DRAFT_460837 [Xylariales sp. PMI_506]|nr:hypothetical protein BX600DRAFT_460837 [Xylariales sp. PMI_506]
MPAQPFPRLRSAGSFWASRAEIAQTLSRLTEAPQRQQQRQPPHEPIIAPTRTLALRLQRTLPEQRERYAPLFQQLLRSNSLRLPIVTFQKLLRQQSQDLEPSLSEILKTTDPSLWKRRLEALARKGWAESDIDHWVWILSGDTLDERVARFVSRDTRKPLFVLLVLLQSGQSFRTPDSWSRIIHYVDHHYCLPKPKAAKGDISGQEPVVDTRLELDVSKFLILLRRLAGVAQRYWPMSLPALAQVTRNYITNLTDNGAQRNGYHKRCKVFNEALELLGKSSYVEPIKNMEFNWRAQKILLSMSDAMDRPLVIGERSYRAIRRVMAAQKKNAAERLVARRYAKSWPPYRQDFDGHDAERTPQDDESRSIRVGVLMTEAGYESNDYDEALGALGGSFEGSPTIQTRSLAPYQKNPENDRGDAFFTAWAMKVRATRNAQEAWRAFNSFTEVKPNLQVYTEMILKLQAKITEPTEHVLAGDAKEAFPVHHGNYSEYELSRLTPPGVQELYKRMLDQNIKPQGHCLTALVANASSVGEGLQYLTDSGLDPTCIAQLSIGSITDHRRFRRGVPTLVLQSYIQLLCRLQPSRRGDERIPADQLAYIHDAINLAKMRLRPGTPEAATFVTIWRVICRALARVHICVIDSTSQIANDMAALEICLDVCRTAEKTYGLDPELFLFLCRTTHKLGVAHLRLQESDPGLDTRSSPASLMQGNSRLGRLFEDASRSMKIMFSKMTQPISQSDPGLHLPEFLHVVGPVQLHTYMRTLAFLEDVTGMTNLMEWIFDNKDFVDEEANRTSRGRLMLVKILCAFEAFAGPHLDANLRKTLDDRLRDISEADGSWRWPSEADIIAYLEADRGGDSLKLHEKIIAAWRKQ